jgi:flavin reductase (DIM6/NTAB) family NADH-FMN oxidoreductase RutF
MTKRESIGVEPGGYRALLGAFATGVTVLTALDEEGRPIGMTASAVSSVSLDPPLLLVCINQTGRMHDLFKKDSLFALSILAQDQDEISTRFAVSAQPFRETRCTEADSGLWLIDNAAAHIECQVWDTHEAGDHTVFFGRVDRGEVFGRNPLIHHRGGYTTTEQ